MDKENIVDSLRAESESDCVAYTEFMLSYKKNDTNKLYLFFEGYEDRFYYPIRIETILNKSNIADFVCIGKDNVLKVHSLIKKSEAYKNIPTLFFVDADFDENNYPDSIYVTPTYSIENLFINQKCVEKILISEFKFSRDSDDLKKVINFYDLLFQDFIQNINVLNVWLSCQSEIRKEKEISTRLKIDNSLKEYFKKSIIQDDLSKYVKIEEISTIENIENIFDKAQKVEIDRFLRKQSEFESVEKHLKFRGKFLLKFLEIFLFKLQSLDSKKYSTVFEKKYSSNLRIEYNTMCSAFSQYAETPDCLRNYLQQFN